MAFLVTEDLEEAEKIKLLEQKISRNKYLYNSWDLELVERAKDIQWNYPSPLFEEDEDQPAVFDFLV